MSIRDQVKEFHERFGHPVGEVPKVPTEHRTKLHLKLICEEFLELFAGTVGLPASALQPFMNRMNAAVDLADFQDLNIVDTADALADLAYVVESMNLAFGIDSDKMMKEVHRSNMSKLGADGKPVYRPDGKVTKGSNYSPPDVYGELKRQGYVVEPF